MKERINGFNIYSRVERLEERVSTFSATSQEYSLLCKELDQTLMQVQQLANEQLENRVVHLFGALENNLVKRELSQIQEKTLSLTKGRISKKAVAQLQKHVNALKENHRTLSKDRKIIQAAEEALLKAQRVSKASVAEVPSLPPLEIECLDPAEIFDVLEVARHLHDGDRLFAKQLFFTLPQSHKERFEQLMKGLPATAFEDLIPTIQALIATANSLVGNGEGYPTLKEIDQYFFKPMPAQGKRIHVDFN